MLILVIILKNCICFTVIMVSMSASARIVALNESVTLTCTATNAAGASYQFSFIREPDQNVTLLNQQVESCSVYSPPPTGYSAACGSGTDDSKSTSKSYTLIINNIKLTDLTQWYCSVVGSNINSNNVDLLLKRGNYLCF